MFDKIANVIFCSVALFLTVSCGGESTSNIVENTNDEKELDVDLNSSNAEESDESASQKLFNFSCDADVLTYLIGKRFQSKNSDIYMEFETYGADISGLKYQWINHKAVSKNKAVIKLSSAETINPDGVITIWIDSHLHTVTDGETVLFYN